jgi:hypothetical protein
MGFLARSSAKGDALAKKLAATARVFEQSGQWFA